MKLPLRFLMLISLPLLMQCGPSASLEDSNAPNVVNNQIKEINASYSETSDRTTIEYVRETSGETSGTYTIVMSGKPKRGVFPFKIAPKPGEDAAMGMANLREGQYTFFKGYLKLNSARGALSGKISGQMISQGRTDTLTVSEVSFRNLAYAKVR